MCGDHAAQRDITRDKTVAASRGRRPAAGLTAKVGAELTGDGEPPERGRRGFGRSFSEASSTGIH